MMRTSNLLSLAVAATCIAAAAPPIHDLIEPRSPVLRGKQVTPREVPFVVSIRGAGYGDSGHVCGGALISSTAVITARHCISDIQRPEEWSVLAGTDSYKGSEIVRTVSQFFVHPSDTDVIILGLSTPVHQSDRIQFAELGPQPVVNDRITIVGWGNSHQRWESKAHGNILQKISGVVSAHQACANLIRSGFRKKAPIPMSLCSPHVFCTNFWARDVGCTRGDSGGPVINSHGQLVGIVSLVFDKACFGHSSRHVHTLLAPIAGWISDVLGGKMKPYTDGQEYEDHSKQGCTPERMTMISGSKVDVSDLRS